MTIRNAANQRAKLRLVLEEKLTAPSVPKSDNRVEFGLGFSDELLKKSRMIVWELIKKPWCPSSNADSILRATQDVQREFNSDCNLRDLNIIYNGENKVELPFWGPKDWVKPGLLSGSSLWIGGSHLWRSGLREDSCETTQATNDIVWEDRNESKTRNGSNCRLPRRN